MGTNYDSPDNLQFNAGDVIFISFIFVEKFKFYGNTSNFTILGKIIFFTLRLRISSPKLPRPCLYRDSLSRDESRDNKNLNKNFNKNLSRDESRDSFSLRDICIIDNMIVVKRLKLLF
jgi:hypothetical protein